MILSALCIVKNEANNLPRWLDGMKQVADEIIVTDTGSTDNSREIVKSAGARLYDYKWQNDFAAARNFTLAQATGDIIIFLDADEYYTQDVLKKLRLRLGSIFGNQRTVGVLAQRINIDANAGNRFLDVSPQLRIFRRGLQYQGKIHENIVIPQGMQLVQDDNLFFYHTGYSKELIKAKLQRNLVMLQEKMADKAYKKQPIDYRYLLDCYYGLGDLPTAFKISGICLSYPQQLRHELNYIYKIRAKTAIFLEKPRLEVESILCEAKEQGDRLYFTLLHAASLYDQGDLRGALPLARTGLDAVQGMDMRSPAYEFLPAMQKIIAEGNSR